MRRLDAIGSAGCGIHRRWCRLAAALLSRGEVDTTTLREGSGGSWMARPAGLRERCGNGPVDRLGQADQRRPEDPKHDAVDGFANKEIICAYRACAELGDG